MSQETAEEIIAETPAEAVTLYGPKQRTRSQIGRSNLQNSKAQERKVVSYLRVAGWPGAERTVRTGYRTSGRTSHDRGDIDGTIGIVWQVKNYAEKEWWRVPKWLAETEVQRIASRADVGILVLRRPGFAHASEWWAYVPLATVAALSGGQLDIPPEVAVRMELRHVVAVLRQAGYGTPPEGVEVGHVESEGGDQ